MLYYCHFSSVIMFCCMHVHRKNYLVKMITILQGNCSFKVHQTGGYRHACAYIVMFAISAWAHKVDWMGGGVCASTYKLG